VTARLAIGALALAAVAGCGDDPPPPPFPITFTAVADEQPLAGVEIRLNDRVLGSTTASGDLRANLRGQEGSIVAYRARCPQGYRTPDETPQLVLRRFRGLDEEAAARGVVVRIDCPPAERIGAVIVRTQPNLPVTMNGLLLARTDAAGVAHLPLRAAPNTSFTLTIDTNENPYLTPRNPVHAFTLADRDEIFIVDQPLEEDRPVVRRRRVRRRAPEPAGPTLPIRLGPTRRR
jgi:hypothetical protein